MIPTSSIKNFKLFGKDERQKVSESVMPAIKQAKSAANLVQVLPNTLKCPCVSIKRALKKRGIKTLKPLISQGFQVSVSILVTQDGCGGRTRTYGLRVMRAPSGRSIDSKSLLDKAGGSYYCVEYSGEIALKSVLCAVAEHHARQPKRHIGEERQNRQHR